MEILLCWLVGLLFAISTWLLLHRNMIRILFGILLMSSSINLLIFTVGRLTLAKAAFIADDHSQLSGQFANALPQALILTAIVIGFGVFTYALVLMTKAWQDIGTMNVDEMRLAEPLESVDVEEERG
ncbi:MAG: cation:proton antiporter [Gammaproteobacteria bacterium]|nr:cation:proton antiporter [Gammaproteobacteria bacterium]MCP4473968.1 cation:proton antiporter [Gammaproteobacteria bacterium]